MNAFILHLFQATFQPETFFEAIRSDKRWSRPILHLLGLAFWLAVASVTAWGLGIPGDTPVNSALGSQMDVYPYWKDTLLPYYGFWSYPLAAGLIAFEMIVISIIWTPLVFVVFRFLGGAKEPGGFLKAFQGFTYGLSPCAFGGFLPYAGLLTGVYACLLQFYRGPALTLKNRTFVPYLFLALFLAFAIARYWHGSLL
jgi:hypothetical protein